MAKSALSSAKDAARKRMNRFLSTYTYVEGEADIRPVVLEDRVELQYSFLTPDPVKRENLRKLFENKGIVPMANVAESIEQTIMAAQTAVEELRKVAPTLSVSDSPRPKFRQGTKRSRIVEMLEQTGQIHSDEVATITGWSNAVNNSELHIIAKIVGRKISKSREGFYSFVD